MGTVWLAKHSVLDRHVAVKFVQGARGVEVLPESASDADSDVGRFLHEARSAAAVRHPNLVTMHDAGLTEGVPYLVMEFVDGPTLGHLLSAGPLTAAVAQVVLRDVASGVAALHDRGVVHRDIKPANVFLDLDGGVRVGDFGLARPQVASEQQCSPCGTPLYMAPEAFRGHFSPHSDVYALGVVAFELLAGRVPFTGSVDEIREQHEHAPLPLDALRTVGHSERLIELIERSCNKRPMFRYKSAREFARALSEVDCRPTAPAASAGKGAAGRSANPGALQARAELRRLVLSPLAKSGTSGLNKSPDLPGAPRPSSAATRSSTSLAEALTRVVTRRGESRRAMPGRLLTPTVSPAPPTGMPPNVSCIHCDYALTTLPTGGRCPECGFHIADTLDPGRLVTSNWQWLRRMRRGTTLVAAGLGLATATPLVAATGAWFAKPWLGGHPTLSDALLEMDHLMRPLFSLLVVAPTLAAGVLYTTAKGGPRPPRRRSRVNWLSSRLILVISIVLTYLFLGTGRLYRPFEEFALSFMLILQGAFAALCAAVMAYFADLAVHVPRAMAVLGRRFSATAETISRASSCVGVAAALAGVISYWNLGRSPRTEHATTLGTWLVFLTTAYFTFAVRRALPRPDSIANE